MTDIRREGEVTYVRVPFGPHFASTARDEDARDEVRRRVERLRARVLSEPYTPEPHPYEQLGLDPELADAAISEETVRSDRLHEQIMSGRIRYHPTGETVDWSECKKRDEADRQALRNGRWRELARRETQTFGRPQLRTLLHLKAKVKVPLDTRRCRPQGRPRSRPRRCVIRRSARSPGRESGSNDPEPPASGGIRPARGRPHLFGRRPW